MNYNRRNEPSGCLESIAAVILVWVLVAVVALVMSLPTMWLWNWLMPVIFHLPKITWVQALGINFLSGILFKSNSAVKSK